MVEPSLRAPNPLLSPDDQFPPLEALASRTVASEPLFHGRNIGDALDEHARGLDEEIANGPESHLMQADEDDWIGALVKRYSVEPPVLMRDDWWLDPPEEIEINLRDYGRPLQLIPEPPTRAK